VHTLVIAVLLRLSFLDPLRNNPKPDPPPGKVRYAPHALRSKWYAVVRSDSVGQSVFPKHPFKCILDRLQSGARQRSAFQKIPALMVHNGQRVAPSPVASEELPLEVSAPEIIGFMDRPEGLRLGRHAPA
jgi:hypothetical protein